MVMKMMTFSVCGGGEAERERERVSVGESLGSWLAYLVKMRATIVIGFNIY